MKSCGELTTPIYGLSVFYKDHKNDYIKVVQDG